MFNIQGGELIFLLLIALVVLGPEKLPDAVRKFGRTYAEFKKVANGFQGELKSALEEPMRELRSTADAVRVAANFDFDAEPTAVTEPAATDGGEAEVTQPQRAKSEAPQPESLTRPNSAGNREATLNFGNAALRAKRPQPESGEEPAE